jgi:putative ABC transport system permease protein
MWLTGFVRGAAEARRTFRRRIGFTLVVAGIFAIPIGFNGAVLTVLDVVLFQAPLFSRPDRLALIELTAENGAAVNRVSGTAFQSLETGTRTMSGMAGFVRKSVVFQAGDRAVRTEAAEVSPALFRMLGVSPAKGRDFESSDSAMTSDCVVIVDDRIWRGSLHGQDLTPAQPVHVDGRLCVVIGVINSTQAFPDSRIELWLPLDPRATLQATSNASPTVISKSFGVVARLKDGMTTSQATDEVRRLQPRELGKARLVTIKEAADRRVRPLLVLLQCVAGLVLLAACINIAGLLLADGFSRHLHTTIRASLGAQVSTLVAERLIETMAISALGGVAGLVIAGWILGLARVGLGAEIPQIAVAALNWRVIAATGGITLFCGLVVGTVSATYTCRPDLREALAARAAASPAASTRKSSNSWRLLVVGEMCVSLALVILAMTLATTLFQEINEDRGFQPDNVALMDISLPPTLYPTVSARSTFVSRMLEDIRQRPEVQSAAAATSLPVSGSSPLFSLEPPVPTTAEVLFRGEKQWRYSFVSESYFETLGIPVREGRSFVSLDGVGTPVAIVSESAADSNGREIVTGFLGTNWHVIGLAGDIKESRLGAEPLPMLYFPIRQVEHHRDSATWRLQRIHLLARSASTSERLTFVLRDVLSKRDPTLVPNGVSTLRSATQRGVAHLNLYIVCFTVLAAAGILIASVGLFALLARLVSAGAREIGIRITLGAEPNRLFTSVVFEGMRLVIGGVIFGLPLAWALRRSLYAAVSGLREDWLAFALGPLLVAAVAAVACLVPAWRATRVDPAVSIRT